MHIGQRQVAEPDTHLEPLNPAEELAGIVPPVQAHTEADMAWRAECQHAIDRQGVAWAVAPQCSFIAPRSKLRLEAGAEIREGVDATLGQLQILQRRGVALRATPEGQRVAACPTDARFVVAPNQAISSLEGMLLAGAEVREELLEGGHQALLSLTHRGVVVDRERPPLSQLPADVALREREMELERAKVDVDKSVEALTADDNAKTQKNYIERKLQLDLAGVRVEAARKAVEVARQAEAQRQRNDLRRKIAELEAQIKSCEAEGLQFRTREMLAARALSDALIASNEHAEHAYQLRIGRNAMFASLHGCEMQFEHPPLTRLHNQLMAIGAAVDLELGRNS
jgi:hypothetical protein